MSRFPFCWRISLDSVLAVVMAKRGSEIISADAAIRIGFELNICLNIATYDKGVMAGIVAPMAIAASAGWS